MELRVLLLANSMTKAIIFDFDGVILDSISIKTSAFMEIFRDYPSDIVDVFIEYHIKNGGISRFAKIRYFFENLLKTNIDNETISILANMFSKIVISRLTEPKYLIEETIDFIKLQYKAKKLFIASGAEQNELIYLCEKFNINQYFSAIYGSPTVKSELIAKILKQNDVSPKELIMIGDSINDYEAAFENNICFFGFNNRSLKNIGNGYIESFAEFTID